MAEPICIIHLHALLAGVCGGKISRSFPPSLPLLNSSARLLLSLIFPSLLSLLFLAFLLYSSRYYYYYFLWHSALLSPSLPSISFVILFLLRISFVTLFLFLTLPYFSLLYPLLISYHYFWHSPILNHFLFSRVFPLFILYTFPHSFTPLTVLHYEQRDSELTNTDTGMDYI